MSRFHALVTEAEHAAAGGDDYARFREKWEGIFGEAGYEACCRGVLRFLDLAQKRPERMDDWVQSVRDVIFEFSVELASKVETETSVE